MSKVFFSSCFDDPAGRRLKIRDRVMALNPTFDRRDAEAVAAAPVWMAENQVDLDIGVPTSSLRKAEICVHGVRDSDVYVAVVRSRHGSGVDLEPDERAQVSYFELELFEAALLQRPAYVFVLEGGALSNRLAGLLNLLGPALPGFDPTPQSEDAIFDRVRTILDRSMHARHRGPLSRRRASGRIMSDLLTVTRFERYDPASAPPGLRFLGGGGDPSIAKTNLDLVRDALDKAAAKPNHHDRLTLLWIALRELMGSPIDDPASREALPYWERALGDWNTSGAWYGLHGHPLMGCLASLGSLADLKARTSGIEDVPHGAMSSEYYSISKLVGRRDLRRAMLDISRAHIDAAFQTGETAGKLAQRGSVRGAQGDAEGAIADFRRVVELRMGAENASRSDIGQAKTELGFALVFNGRRGEGLSLMEEGIGLFEGEPNGFQVRALRKLGRAYLRAGSPLRALDTLAAAHRCAEQTGAMDQITQIDTLARQIGRHLGRMS